MLDTTSLLPKDLKRIRNSLEKEIRIMEKSGIEDTEQFNTKLKTLEFVRNKLESK
jgi:hypothetical protein